MITRYYLDSAGGIWCWLCIEQDQELAWTIIDEEPWEPKYLQAPSQDTLIRVCRSPVEYPSCKFCGHAVNHECNHQDFEEALNCFEVEVDENEVTPNV